MKQLCINVERKAETDVLVIGGGVAGCAAAIAAARNGVKTILVENTGVLGGQAGIGIVTPISATSDRSGKTFGGIMREICINTRELGQKYCAGNDKKYPHWAIASPHIIKYVLLKICVESGVEVRFHTTLVSSTSEGAKIKSAILLDKSGFIEIEAKSFIDASGDGDLIAASGAEFQLGSEKGVLDSLTANGLNVRHFSDEDYEGYEDDEKVMQPASIFFVMGGVDFEKARVLDNKHLRFGDLGITKERFLEWEFANTYGFEVTDDSIPTPQGRVLVTRGPRSDMAVINMSRVIGVDGSDADSLNEGEIKGQLQLIAIVDFLQKFIPGFEDSYLIQSANTLGVRESRRLKGRYILTGNEAILCKPRPDAVAKGSYIIDIHDPKGKSAAVGGDIKGDSYDIPYGCLLAREFDNLLVCGRCISVDHVAHASTRIQGTCMLTGQAVGTASALAIKKGIEPANLAVQELRAKLIEEDIKL